jgi:hypothetical protein
VLQDEASVAGKIQENLRSNWRNISQKVLGTLTVE